MKIFYKRKQMIGFAISAAIVSNSLVVGNATGIETSDNTEEKVEAKIIETKNDEVEAVEEVEQGAQTRSSGGTYKVVVDSLNVRTGPSTSYSVLGSLKEGAVIEVQSINDGWAKLNFNGKTGYCSANSDYLQKTTTRMKVVVDSLNVRTGPGVDYSLLGSLKEGAVIEVQSINDGWAKLNFNGKTGYCNASSKYLQKTTESPSTGGGSESSQGVTAKVTEDVNLRKSADWGSEKLAVIKKSSTVEVIEKGSSWTKVKYSGKTGYIASEYLTGYTSGGGSETPQGTTSKVTEDVNLRKSADWGSEKLAVIKKGSTVEVIEKGSSWTKVKYSGKTGYIANEYLSGSTSGGGSETPQGTTSKVTEDVNLRKSADWGSEKLAVIKKGSTVEVIEKGSSWTKVKYSGKTGYIANEYLSGSTSGGGSETPQGEMVTVTEPTWLRKTADWGAEKIVVLEKGDKAEYISRSGDWIKVKYSGHTGYLSADFVSGAPSGGGETTLKKYKVTTDSLNVRSGPGTNHDKIGAVTKGEVIEVYSITSGWAKMKYGTKTGYVSADYITAYDGSDTGGSGSTGKGKKVYLDPGHGGKDSGAVGRVYGTKEKDAALDVTKRLASKLKDKGYTVIESRTSDVYPSLSERYNDANNKGANIFVSMHFNSAEATSAVGIETLYKVDGRTSNVLADQIQDELIDATGLRDRGLKQRSDLAVLNGTKMPAVLVEGGFISNSNEENLIKSSSYRENLANAILRGIEDYFKVSK